MANSPLLFGPNNRATNLQNGMVNADGSVNKHNGPVNYLANPGWATGTTAGWSLFSTTITGGYPTGTITNGAASITTFQAQTTTVITGVYSLQVSSSAAWAAGQGFISDPFTIANADKSRVLGFRFNYQNTSAASELNLSGTLANTLQVWIYDVTNAVWIQPAGSFSMAQGAGVGLAQGSFQASANGTQYRIAVLATTASAGAGATLYFDDCLVGPQSSQVGVPVTPWVAYTPTFTGFGTVSGVVAYSRRVGDTLECSVAFVSGTPTATQARITMGFNGSNGNVTSLGSFGSVVLGSGAVNANAAATFFPISEVFAANYVYLGVSSGTTAGYSALNGNVLAASGQALSLFWRVPITGWSTNVVMSTDQDNRVVACALQGSSTATVNSALNYQANLTATYDTHGAWNAGSNAYIAPMAGVYWVDFNYIFNASAIGSSAQTMQARIYVNFISIPINQYNPAGQSGNQGRNGRVQGLISLKAGDSVSFFIYQDTGSTLTLAGPNGTWANIFKLSGATTIAASESVTARYSSTAGAVLSTSDTIVDFPTRDYDSHMAVTTGSGWRFTAPISGRYAVKLFAQTQGFAGAVSAYIAAKIYKNGSLRSRLALNGCETAAAGQVKPLEGCDTVYLLAGEYIDLRFVRDATITPSLSTATGDVYVAIERVGN